MRENVSDSSTKQCDPFVACPSLTRWRTATGATCGPPLKTYRFIRDFHQEKIPSGKRLIEWEHQL